jgi:hypothetical protein
MIGTTAIGNCMVPRFMSIPPTEWRKRAPTSIRRGERTLVAGRIGLGAPPTRASEWLLHGERRTTPIRVHGETFRSIVSLCWPFVTRHGVVWAHGLEGSGVKCRKPPSGETALRTASAALHLQSCKSFYPDAQPPTRRLRRRRP